MTSCQVLSFVTAFAAVCFGDPLPDSGPCVCAKAKAAGGWCPECKIGFLAGVRIPSQDLYETIDVHGHEINLAALSCPTCTKYAADGGYCDTCRIGFYRKRVYFSLLSFELAKGVPLEREKLNCQPCRLSAENGRWCEACGRGWIGNVALSSKSGFETAKQEFARLKSALELLARCEDCAVACFTQNLCPKCRKDFAPKRAQNNGQPR
jgi:hypothetical protein